MPAPARISFKSWKVFNASLFGGLAAFFLIGGISNHLVVGYVAGGLCAVMAFRASRLMVILDRDSIRVRSWLVNRTVRYQDVRNVQVRPYVAWWNRGGLSSQFAEIEISLVGRQSTMTLSPLVSREWRVRQAATMIADRLGIQREILNLKQRRPGGRHEEVPDSSQP